MKDVVRTITTQIQEQDFTPEQLKLIKDTVAKGATNDELSLFLYRCRHMMLDPLKPGQIYFVKYGTSPGTIVIGLEGFRTKAGRTGKHVGTKRGLLLNDSGKCVGAWCEIYRSDWTHPAREEVSMAEYNTGKAMWAKMPETMIRKVAEVAALRMAFPDELGGIYSDDEMDQAEPRDVRAREIESKIREELPAAAAPAEAPPPTTELAADYIIKVGKNKGKQIKDLSEKDISNFVTFYDEKLSLGERMHPDVIEYYTNIQQHLSEREVGE